MRLRASHLPEYADTRRHHPLFLGKAGERYVAAHLLRQGFNAAEAPVDTGVDLLAHRHSVGGDSLVYQVQVKTTTSLDWTQSFSLQRFGRLCEQLVNLVVVFWPGARAPVAVVIPPSLLYFFAHATPNPKYLPIYSSSNGKEVVLRLVLRDLSTVYVRRRTIDCSPLVNAFHLIEDTTCDPFHIPPYVGMQADGKSIDFVRV